MLHTLRAESPVKWTLNQEKTICQDYPWSGFSSETAADYVSRTYTQFLWLPESIMPLSRLTLALLRVASLFPEEFASGSRSRSRAHPLHELLKPCLLTTRTATEKWNSTIPKVLASEESDGSPGYEIMWFSLKYEKTNEVTEIQDPDDAEEQCRANWLQRMEQREVMIQIILHLLLLSLPGTPDPTPGSPKVYSIDAPSPSPKKRKRTTEHQQIPLDDRLEAFMDRLSMWQLMSTIDETIGGDESLVQSQSGIQEKGKDKAVDERDWMQKFCNDVVQPLFEETLPDHCMLLHSKVFQYSPFSDDSDPFSPPASPKGNAKRLFERTSSTATTASQSTTYPSQDRALSRTSSLSASLQEERVRERSKSLSIGPGNMRKRALTREVSMSTAFKGKTKPTAASRTAVMRDKEKRSIDSNSKKGGVVKDQGVTLVEATPMKPKQGAGSSRSQRVFQSKAQHKDKVLPSMLQSSRLAVEGDDDDDDWTVQSSPDILFLKPDSSEEADAAWQATPTKRPRAKRAGRVH